MIAFAGMSRTKMLTERPGFLPVVSTIFVVMACLGSPRCVASRDAMRAKPEDVLGVAGALTLFENLRSPLRRLAEQMGRLVCERNAHTGKGALLMR